MKPGSPPSRRRQSKTEGIFSFLFSCFGRFHPISGRFRPRFCGFRRTKTGLQLLSGKESRTMRWSIWFPSPREFVSERKVRISSPGSWIERKKIEIEREKLGVPATRHGCPGANPTKKGGFGHEEMQAISGGFMDGLLGASAPFVDRLFRFRGRSGDSGGGVRGRSGGGAELRNAHPIRSDR